MSHAVLLLRRLRHRHREQNRDSDEEQDREREQNCDRDREQHRDRDEPHERDRDEPHERSREQCRAHDRHPAPAPPSRISLPAPSAAPPSPIPRRGRRRRRPYPAQRIYRVRCSFLELSDEQALRRCRLDRAAIAALCRELGADLQSLTGRSHALPVAVKVTSALAFLASGSFQTASRLSTGISQSAMSNCLAQFLAALQRRAGRYIAFPPPPAPPGDPPALPGVLGLVGAMHVALRAPADNEPLFRNAANFHSINMQVVCDRQGHITNVVAKFPGSCANATVLENSALARLMEGSRPEGVIRVTGFLRGLYTDFELKSDNVKDKDSKINFLQKAIDAVVMVTGEPLSVKPARVVAGHEPEKTNEFLQAIGKCCLNKLSSDAAVKRVLAGEKADAKGKPPPSKPRHKESREPKAEEQKSHKDKESRRDTEIKDRSPSRDRKPKGDLKESREREKERDKQKNNEERHKEPERDTSKEGEKQEREGGKSRTTKQGRETEKPKGKGDPERGEDLRQDKGQEREKRHEGGREKDRLKGRDKDKARDREGEKDRERRRDRDREKDGEHLREHGKEKAEKKPSDSEESMHRKPQRPTKDSKCQPDTENEAPARISKQPSVKASRHPSKPGGEGAVDTRSVADGISEDGAAELQEKNEPGLAEKQKEREVENAAPDKPENGEAPPDVPPRPAQRRIPRPGSARPAPPRVKHQGSTELLTPERSGSAKTAPSVLREQQVSDEEDEQFVVETAGPLPEMPKEPEVELVEDQKHGGLVKRILETKKDYEASQKSSQTTDREKPIVSETSRKRERDLVAREIEKFQGSIQTVCQHVLRLGRMVDYIQEDMDAMRNELLLWRQENREHAEALRREQSITDSTLEPLKAELAELEQLMKDQQDKICAAKANNLRNDEKIQRMILSINVSSRR